MAKTMRFSTGMLLLLQNNEEKWKLVHQSVSFSGMAMLSVAGNIKITQV
jgi:hypothetical protein